MAAHCFDATTFVGPCNHKARGQHHNPPAPGRSHYLKIKRKQVCNKFFIGMKRIHTILIILLLAVTYGEAKKSSDDRQMDDFITSLMKKMTLEEKIGQLNLGGVGSPKVVGSAIGLDEAIRKGLVSSVGGFDAKAAPRQGVWRQTGAKPVGSKTKRRQASDGPGLFSPCAEDPGVVKWICYTTDGI